MGLSRTCNASSKTTYDMARGSSRFPTNKAVFPELALALMLHCKVGTNGCRASGHWPSGQLNAKRVRTRVTFMACSTTFLHPHWAPITFSNDPCYGCLPATTAELLTQSATKSTMLNTCSSQAVFFGGVQTAQQVAVNGSRCQAGSADAPLRLPYGEALILVHQDNTSHMDAAADCSNLRAQAWCAALCQTPNHRLA